MAQYIVLTTSDNELPEPGKLDAGMIYVGEHGTEEDAVEAAADLLELGDGDRLWASSADGLASYTNTTTVSRIAEAE